MGHGFAERRVASARTSRGRRLVRRGLIALIGLLAAAGVAAADSELFVVGDSGIRVFPQTAAGDVPPARAIRPAGAGVFGGVAVDAVNNEVFVSDASGAAIHVFARTADGNVAPVRTIQGALTLLDNPFGMFVDTVHDELIVADGGADLVLVFSRTASGNVAPIRKIQNHQLNDTGFFAQLGVFVDLVHDELLVSGTKLETDVIMVFPRTASGVDVPALREISGGFNSFLEGLFVDTAADEIIATSSLVAGEVRVYPRLANSPPNSLPAFPPKRVISGPLTGLDKPVGLGVDVARGEITVTSRNPGSVRTFPLTANGNIAPTRVITGPATGIGFSPQMMALAPVPAGLPAPLLAAVLPAGRSVRTGTAATAFATLINTGAAALANCELAPLTGPTTARHTFSFQTTDPLTNALTGTPVTPVTVPGNSAQTFVFAFTPVDPFPPLEVQLAFQCANAALAPITVGLNTFLLSASSTPVPDIVALAATAGNNGIVDIPGDTGTGAFAVATVNVGASGEVVVTADTGGVPLPVILAVCETDPLTSVCMAPPGPSVTAQIGAGATPTFAVFVTGTPGIATLAGASREAVTFDPANHRIFVRFSQGSVVRGATSVAPRTL